MVSTLSSPGGVVWIRTPTGDILFSDIFLSQCHSPPTVQMGTGEFNAGSNPAMYYYPIQGDCKYS